MSSANQHQFDANRYQQLLTNAALDSEQHWRQVGERLQWSKPFTRVKDVSFLREDFRIRWYEDGELNVSVNCLDRHLAQYGDKIAIRFEADEAGKIDTLTYQQLHEKVCRLANGLRSMGIAKGDRVSIYMPMIPEAAIAMLACARIGAVHSVVFGGFSPDALIGRIADCGSKLVITADGGMRGGKVVPLKANVDQALADPQTACVEKVIVLKHLQLALPSTARDVDFAELCAQQASHCEPAAMQAEDPLFILYTSGSTGKPKGVLHTTGGYLAYASYTHALVFDLQANDVYWCTADVGWITGHSYVVYGPLSNAATTVMFEGVPNYPTPARFWQMIDRHQVTIFYTAPTAIRALMRDGDGYVKQATRSSLRLLGTVGEPINPEAWRWYFEVCGDGRCPIVDTFWQTETGGILISPVPGTSVLKPGSAMQALPGIQPALVDANGMLLTNTGEAGAEVRGHLVFCDSWPGQMRTVYGDHQRFFDTYFTNYPGYYFTGDGARRDADGHYWITGRVDDVINTAGHRLGTAEIESALIAHLAVAESAVVGYPHDIKGQGIYAFVTLKQGYAASPALRAELVQTVRRIISPIATPDVIQFTQALPKTRSGKIMRRILRKIANNELDQLGDVSTLADPAVVVQIIAEAYPQSH